ncbi:hypothetical protein F5Y00DRAFT_247906 [Daldinia vernicosa]|uniref:uncharacterized protein n=1 Tax=Daldinia vernicosa TaxID=114800 RepID=UPI002007B8DB|nr:uncharacterized protein F5Y00DRAFT_247906 [Daldinia vernicosa]KAI0844779.1 hypothetical protein F5Y00DRAFT_247906 [Daldinia vernicosa]
MPGGLEASRWAPAPTNYRINKQQSNRNRRRSARTSSSSLSQSTPSTKSASRSDNFLTQDELSNGLPPPEYELSRFLKIVARLNWKMPFLKEGYRIAIDNAGKPPSQVEAHEIQFKLDFHEFYMLIERALVRLMGIFGIAVKNQGATINGVFTLYGSSEGGQHRYHANVLRALEDSKNPLNVIFGAPEVKKQLMRAKDLRNRWKNIDEADSASLPPAPLSAYNLELMVQTILSAIERAHAFTVEYVVKREGKPMNTPSETVGEKDWEFMVDAMDWEAV